MGRSISSMLTAQRQPSPQSTPIKLPPPIIFSATEVAELKGQHEIKRVF
jgi:hypothetical protein